MTFPDTFQLAAGIPVAAIVPILVELAKRYGLPTRASGLTAIVFATVLFALGGLALGEMLTAQTVARWVIGGIVYGLAAAGIYSQRRLLGNEPPSPPASIPTNDRGR